MTPSYILNQLNSIFDGVDMNADSPIPVIDQIDEYIENILLSCLEDHERCDVDPEFKKAFDDCPWFDDDSVKEHEFEHEDRWGERQIMLIQEYFADKNLSYGNQGQISIEDYKKYKRNLNR